MNILYKTTLCLGLLTLISCTKSDIIIDDFESGNFDKWQIEGDAFGSKPSSVSTGTHEKVAGFEGKYFASSFAAGGDSLTGILTSKNFKIERDYINFLLGGGKNNYVELIIDGKSIYKTHPIVDSESLTLLTWDVKSHLGKDAVIKITDNQTGGWGHILVDQIEMSNTSKSDIIREYSMNFSVNKKYILIPIENEAPYTYVHIESDGKIVSPQLDIRIAQTKVEYWMPIDVEHFEGKNIKLLFDHVKKSDIGHSQIKLSDTYDFNYNEKYRPQYHFSPQYGWTNDPNGMVYQNGEYHLYFQHNPYGVTWGNMNWGHATSKDLIKWEYLPIALAPDSLGAIFSGSAVIDKNNTAGFGENALVAIYTSAGDIQTQSIAYSLDNGITFTKYENNPVLTDLNYRDFRDPKVFWHEASNQWVMSLATTQVITFYGSKNLKEWTKLSDFGEGIGNHEGVWECPDLIPISYNGQTKWVLIVSINPGGPNGGSASQYFIGQFDGKQFKADNLPYPLWLDYGRDNYAGVAWNNSPDNRHVFIGWMSNWDYANQVPTTNFANAMTLPRELGLAHNGKHLVMTSNPVEEIKDLRDETITVSDIDITSDYTIEKLLKSNNGAYEIEMDIEVSSNPKSFSFKLLNREKEELNFIFDLSNESLLVDRSKSGSINFSDRFATSSSKAPLVKKEIYKIRLFMDNASSELFVNNGEVVQTNIIFPKEPYNTMTFNCDGGAIKVKNIKIHTLK